MRLVVPVCFLFLSLSIQADSIEDEKKRLTQAGDLLAIQWEQDRKEMRRDYITELTTLVDVLKNRPGGFLKTFKEEKERVLAGGNIIPETPTANAPIILRDMRKKFTARRAALKACLKITCRAPWRPWCPTRAGKPCSRCS